MPVKLTAGLFTDEAERFPLGARNGVIRTTDPISDTAVTPFAANVLVDSDTGGLLDWRADYAALRYEPVSLPRSVESSLLRMT